ncbi:MAG: clostripain-related cysteine peptidase [Vicinamibacteraceae bacterium]
MDVGPGARKPWAVLAYTVADDKGSGDSLDVAAKEELRSLCNAADFGQMSVAAQVDFKHTRGVFRGVLTEAPPKKRGFEAIPADSHPLWRGIKARLDRSKLRVLKDIADLNASRANVLTSFLRFGQRECPADRYVIFFYGHGYGPLGLFFDAEADDAAVTSTMPLTTLSASLEAVGDRAAVIVFRACLANTLETAYQLRDAGEFMIASQSIVPIAGIWPWGSFLASLMPGATSGDVARAIAQQLALFLDTPANRAPFADVPYSLLDLGAARAIAEPLTAIVQALESARVDSARMAACAAALEGARVGFPDDFATPGDPALLDVPTMCENLARLTRDPVAAPARGLGDVVERRLVTWHHSQKAHHRGIGLFYKPARAAHVTRSHLYEEGTAEGDAKNYRQLALSQATGWDRIALNPLG